MRTRSPARPARWKEREALREAYIVPEDHPTISRTYEAGGFEGAVDPFEFGLQLILDGTEARVAAARGGA